MIRKPLSSSCQRGFATSAFCILTSAALVFSQEPISPPVQTPLPQDATLLDRQTSEKPSGAKADKADEITGKNDKPSDEVSMKSPEPSAHPSQEPILQNRSRVAKKDKSEGDPVAAITEMVRRRDLIMAHEMLENLIRRYDIDKDTRARAMALRSLIALESNKPSEAIVKLNAFLEQYPDRPEAAQLYLLLGQTYRNEQAHDRAREAFYKTLTSVVAKASNSKDDDLTLPTKISKTASWELAETEYQAKNWDRANDLFQRFHDQNPESLTLVHTALYRQADCATSIRPV